MTSSGVRSRIVGRLLPVVALFLGSAPSFALPFVLASSVGTQISDVFFLGVSITQILGAVLNGTYDSALMAVIGAHAAVHTAVPVRSLVRMAGRGAVLSALPTIVGYPLLAIAFTAASSGRINLADLIGECWPLVLVPIVAATASAPLAYLYARGMLVPGFMSSIFRGAPCVAIAFLGGGVVELTLAFLLGEVLRLLFLSALAGRRARRAELGADTLVPVEPPRLSSLLHQGTSTAVSQLVFLLVRGVLAAGPTGSITVGEIALRINGAANQIVNSGIVLPKLAALPSELVHKSAREIRGALVRSGIALAALSGGLAVVVALGITGVLVVPGFVETHSIRDGLLWTFVILFAIPLTAVGTLAVRALVLAHLARFLTPIAVATLLAAALTCLVGVGLVGGVAAIAAFVAGQLVASTALYVLALRRGTVELEKRFA